MKLIYFAMHMILNDIYFLFSCFVMVTRVILMYHEYLIFTCQGSGF